jgi:hypothetical protein
MAGSYDARFCERLLFTFVVSWFSRFARSLSRRFDSAVSFAERIFTATNTNSNNSGRGGGGASSALPIVIEERHMLPTVLTSVYVSVASVCVRLLFASLTLFFRITHHRHVIGHSCALTHR